MRTRVLLPALVCGLAAACAHGNHDAAGRTDEPTPDNSAIVIRGTEFSGTVLDALRSRIPAARITTDGTACPRIIFRGQRSMLFQQNPSVYVDSTPMLDTCILTQISSSDVDFIEVYVSGVSPRPSIRRNPFGVILVYRRVE